jgi:hypothetical protein
MRKPLLLVPALLAACATTPAPPVQGVTPGHTCDAAGAQSFVGQPGNSETGAAILSATHAAVLRWAPPGYMMTMDFRADRVTVYLGPDYRITKVSCG